MKLSCSQENLNRGLAIVGRAVAGRTTLPITNNILLATEGNRLRLAATNLELSISFWLDAQVEEEGTITVPSRLITDFVNSLPNDRTSLALSPGSRTLELRCARYEARISGLDSSDFPQIPRVADVEGTAIEVAHDALRQAINHVAFAASVEDSRPVLTGVQAEFDGDQLTLAAADGFRLAVHSLSLSSQVEKMAVIIPARCLSELTRLLGDHEDSVGITVNSKRNQVLFKLKDIEVVSQLIQGTFPNYHQLIPKGFATRAVVSLSDFLKATRSASVFARDGSGIVRLMMTPRGEASEGKMSISARAEEVGDNLGEVDAVVEGEEAKIAFNGKYLTDVLGVLSGEKVALETTSPSSPGAIRLLGTDNYVHVVMPMFVQW
ncbi:DNA polymerase III subunit beta [Chloroflexota bacterium]